MMTYRVNAARSLSALLNDPQIGGGRIIGEACHFIDLMSYLTGDAEIVSVDGRGGRLARGSAETSAPRSFSLTDRSATCSNNRMRILRPLQRAARGAWRRRSAVIDDFRSAVIHVGRKTSRVRANGKGHAEALAGCLRAARAGEATPELSHVPGAVMRATFAISSRCQGS